MKCYCKKKENEEQNNILPNNKSMPGRHTQKTNNPPPNCNVLFKNKLKNIKNII